MSRTFCPPWLLFSLRVTSSLCLAATQDCVLLLPTCGCSPGPAASPWPWCPEQCPMCWVLSNPLGAACWSGEGVDEGAPSCPEI